MTQTEYAKYLGVTKQTVSNLVKLGKIPIQKGKINPEKADKALEKNSDPARAHLRTRPTKQTNGKKQEARAQVSWQEIRTEKEYYLAKLGKLEYQRSMGELVNADQVKHDAFKTARIIRDTLLNIPTRVAGQLAGELGLSQGQGQEQVFQILNKEIQQALEVLTT